MKVIRLDLSNSYDQQSVFAKSANLRKRVQIASLKEDFTLFSRLYIACQCRDGNLNEFFKYYENQPWPSALSQMDQLRGGQKVDLVKSLEINSVSEAKQPPVDAIIPDCSCSYANDGTRSRAHSWGYLNSVFQPFILKQLESASRIDILWDVYRKDSLKSAMRENRGSGSR